MSKIDNSIMRLISQGEGISVEFKTCRHQLSRDIYETVCAFLNRHGGTLLIGVQDNGEILGIDPNAVVQIKKDFVTAINNPQKIYPPAYFSISEVLVNEKIILHVYVPESSQVHRCTGRIFDRNEDGDFDISDHTNHVANMYLRKQATFTENKIYSSIKLDDLRIDLIEKCRKIARFNTQNHPWAQLNDLQLLQSAQLYQTDPQTRVSGITLAGILLFGTDQLILTVVPAHRTDLILRKVNTERYDDRDLVRTNLIDSYDRILAFVQKHLPDPFYLDGIERVSLRDIIFREVASNLLIHREYTNAIPARLIIENGQVRTENANKPHGFGVLNLALTTPYPKNPIIGAFFREIHRADELGSGIRKLQRYGKAYGGADPELMEGDIFQMVIKVPEFGASGETTPPVTPPVIPPVTPPVTTEIKKLLAVLEGSMNRQAIQANLGLKAKKNFLILYLRPALELGYIEMTIPDKPNSRLQKYRLTEKGKQIAEANND